MRKLRVGSIGVVSLALSGLPAPSTQAAFPGANGRVAFTSYSSDASSHDVFTVGPDGSGRAPLTDSASGADYPAWSPDGSKIAVNYFIEGTQGGQSVVTVMDADGTNATAITSGNSELFPAWSPDGTRIAFVEAPVCPTNPECPKPDIYTIKPDGTGLARVTNANGLNEGHLSWLVPGSVKEGRRSIWALDQVQVLDGGADGLASTQPNAEFLAQGVFAP